MTNLCIADLDDIANLWIVGGAKLWWTKDWKEWGMEDESKCILKVLLIQGYPEIANVV